MHFAFNFGHGLLLTLWMFTGAFSSLFAQTGSTVQTQNQWPTAEVVITIDSTIRSFDFQLYYDMPEWKAERLEERMILSYPDMQGIEINSANKTVHFDVLNTSETATINLIFRHFKYQGYEEL